MEYMERRLAALEVSDSLLVQPGRILPPLFMHPVCQASGDDKIRLSLRSNRKLQKIFRTVSPLLPRRHRAIQTFVFDPWDETE